MKVLITGVAGFVGSTLAEELLHQGHQLIGVDCFLDYYPRSAKEKNLTSLMQQQSFELIDQPLQEVDLPTVLDGVDWIFHLAAQAGVRASWGDEFSIYTTNNIQATQRLLEAATRTKPRSLVYASSSSVYGDAAELPMREEVALHPVSPYGVTKLAAEMLCHLYYHNHGVPTVSLRYFTVYGPRQRPDMAFHKLLKAAWLNESFPLFGDGEQTRDFTFIQDAVQATMAAAESGKPGAVYNIGGGSRVSMKEVMETIRQVTGRELKVDRLPVQKGDMRDTYADTSAARRDLSYRPATSLKDGLAAEWEWIQRQYSP